MMNTKKINSPKENVESKQCLRFISAYFSTYTHRISIGSHTDKAKRSFEASNEYLSHMEWTKRTFSSSKESEQLNL